MVYLVQNENPRPDSYIAIFIRSSLKELEDRNRYEIFRSRNKAVERAEKLAEKFSVQTIRLFHEEGYSENIKRGKK